jgi:predicted dehydrogenase
VRDRGTADRLLSRGKGDGPAPRVLIVGAGKAGIRFLRSMRYLATAYGALTLAGLCDTVPDRLAPYRDELPVHDDVSVALDALRPDVVCVCVNEVAHCEVLTAVARHGTEGRLVLCEKPLTETLEQFERVESRYPPDAITVNFVERYSPIVDEFTRWRQAHAVEALRVEFFWGKYRLMDARPTMGVFSEISHPVDLVRALVGLPEDTPFELLDASTSASDFSVGDRAVPDSVDTSFLLDGRLPVRGHASFLWPARNRRFVLYYTEPSTGRLYQAVLTFDAPRWDEDHLEIWRIGRRGTRVLEHEVRYTNADFPAELDQIFKVARFTAESLRLRFDPRAADGTVRIRGARWVQEAIEEMTERSATAGKVPVVSFGAGR